MATATAALGAYRNPGMAALYLTCNRNKRSIVLDLKQPSAIAAVMQLAKNVDVVIHNNRPQIMTKLGLDYAAFKAVNPKIIYCGTYGYGAAGPYGERGALDDSIQAVSGIAMLNEMVLGEPRYLPTIVADKTTAMQVVSAVTAALYSRERTGDGQEIEVPMFETMVYYTMAEHLWGMAFEPQIGGPGYTRLMSHHRKPYKTKDGYIAILPYLDAHWEMFCKLSGHEELLTDPRFKTLATRVANIDDTYQETAKIMLTRTTDEWLEMFGEDQRADEYREYAAGPEGRSASEGGRFLAGSRSSDRRPAAHDALSGHLLRNPGQRAAPAAAARRAHRRSPARNRHRRCRDPVAARFRRGRRSALRRDPLPVTPVGAASAAIRPGRSGFSRDPCFLFSEIAAEAAPTGRSCCRSCQDRG